MTVDTWDLRTMREAKAYRDANPDPASADTDRWLDRQLELAEAEAAERGVRQARPVADETSRPRGRSDGSSNYASTGNPATDAQLGYIKSLEAKLSHELQVPRDKRHASLIIDGAKQELAKRGTSTAYAPRPERMATERQIDYVSDLLAKKVHDHGDLDASTLTFAQATSLIDTLRLAPRRPKGDLPTHGIREGHYAWVDAEEVAHFYRVTSNGSIKVIAGPAEHPYHGQLNEALLAIKADPRAAAVLYGLKIGRCGRCHTRLSNDGSLERGLGPYCAEKTDW
jgi:hypothetical protein